MRESSERRPSPSVEVHHARPSPAKPVTSTAGCVAFILRGMPAHGPPFDGIADDRADGVASREGRADGGRAACTSR